MFLYITASTQAQRDAFSEAMDAATSIKNSQGDTLEENTMCYSEYTQHPSKGEYLYKVDSRYDGSIEPTDQGMTCDNVTKTVTQVKALGFFPPASYE